ncbi:TonB-dependent receptor [Sphingopyxis sp.]|uniref:TonB-dependent receptor n=1 Tax=Sphingopyxis sp. TaxID=1908224 RepID=UPI0026381F2E|nr:TonB-dependent receptor [Sphingopyxis sp.]MCW0198821.1 TonB-dependent receptor [Sphingopyxis sp.]
MKLRYSIAASLMAISVATVVAAPAQAQQITTGIQGQVNDDNGGAIAGAKVIITDTRTGAARTFTTGADGRFAATGLVTGGPYSVSVSADSFEGQTLQDIYTSLQGNTDLAFSLSSGGGEIVVTGTRVRVTQLAVGPGNSFTTEVLESAPSFNRDVRDIIRLDPRVSLDRDDGGSGQDRISCLGGNDRGNAFTVDGISQGDVYGLNDTGFSSRSSTPIPYDAVRETQVQFAPFDVDYGSFTGCAINVVTKSGTNDYHFGGFFEYSDNGMRGDSLPGIAKLPPVKPEKRWGLWAGAPIIKDRLFIFGAYEHQEAGQAQDDGPVGGGYANEQTGITVDQFNEISGILKNTYGVDTGPLVTNRPYSNDRYFGRLDWQITDNHRLELTYQRLEEGSTRPDDLFTGTSPQAVGLNTFYTSGTKSNYYSGRLYSQWTDNFSTELRYSRSEVRDRQDPIGGGEAQSANPIPRIIVGIDNPTGIDGTVLAGPGTSRSANDLRTDIDQYRAVAKLVAGSHTLKIGAELNRANLFNLFVQNATGTLVFRNIDDLRAGLLSPGAVPAGPDPACRNVTNSTTPVNVVNGCTYGAFGNFSSTGDINDAAAAFTRSIYSIFAQDDWEISDRLNAVIGVRTDWYDGGNPRYNPVFAQRYGIPNTTGFSNLAPVVMPRLALTYDMDDFAVFGRPKLSAGVGIFSGGDPVVWFGNAFQNDGRGFNEGNTGSSNCPTGQISVLTGGQFSGVPTCIQAAGISTAARGLGDTQSISPDIKMPTVLRANIGFQSELNFAPSGFFSGWNLNLDYIYSKYRNPLTLVDLSQTVNPNLGLNGYTIDGRPIYRAIDPNVAGCTAKLVGLNPAPVYEDVNAVCFNTGRDDELQLTNSAGYRSHNASIILSKTFDGGLFTENGSVDFNFGYAYTDSQDRRSMYNSTAGSNYDYVAAFDRQNPGASRSFYESRHNISTRLAFREEFFNDLSTRFAISFIARSGRPYSLTFGGSGIFNDSVSGSNNALAYLPTGIDDPNISPSSNMTAVKDLVAFASGLGCAKKYVGKTIPRNTCSNDWYFDMDLSFSQELPGPGRLFGRNDKIKLYATMDNFLNFLDKDWNVQRRRNFAGLQDIASLGSTGFDSDGRYIISGFNGVDSIADDNGINTSSSVWRLKIGVSYEF